MNALLVASGRRAKPSVQEETFDSLRSPSNEGICWHPIDCIRAVYSAHTSVSVFNAIIPAIERLAQRRLNDSDNVFRGYLIQAMNEDIARIKERPSVQEGLTWPLWELGPPTQVLDLWKTCKEDFLLLNTTFKVWCDWYEKRLRGSDFDLNVEELVAFLPPEILSQGIAAANNRISQLILRTAQRPLNRARAIFLGHGDAGKTSLIRALHAEDVVFGDQQMTRGLQISERRRGDHVSDVDVIETQTSNSDLIIHYWDFGGQVIAHHAHQFFLRSNCLYVLVIDGRRSERANDDARYWLEHIRAYGGDAPVMLVGNKIDLAPVQIDLLSLKQIFPNIVDYYPLSCTQYKNSYSLEFARFECDFFKLLEGPVLTRQVLLTEPEFLVLEQVRESSGKGPFLKIEDFSKICEAAGIERSSMDQQKLVDLFDKLGVVIHFPDIPLLDEMLLNPEWLTRAVYEILYSQALAVAGGVIDRSTIFNIVESADLVDHLGRKLLYTRRQCFFIIEAMRQFRLLFSMTDDQNVVVVPALLNTFQPENDFDRSEALAFRIRFEGFMPSHVLPNLIVERSHEIYNEQVWRFGCRLNSGTEKVDAFIQADEHARTLTIWCVGDNANEYLCVLRDKIIQSLGKMSHLRFFEEILLNPSIIAKDGSFQAPTWESYTQIRAELKRQRQMGLHESLRQFVATNEDQYDLSRISEIVPKRRSPMRILFLAANSMPSVSLDLENELRSLEVEIRGTRYRDNVILTARHAVQPDDLVRYIRADRPSVVHFSGHSSKKGIFLRDGKDGFIKVSAPTLRQLLEGRGIKLLVLNACYTQRHAKELLGAVNTIIGTTGAVGDDAALRFTIAFYRTLADGGSIRAAFRDGRDAVVLYGLKDVFGSAGDLDATPFELLEA
jgi:GTPase SAR1 family protein